MSLESADEDFPYRSDDPELQPPQEKSSLQEIDGQRNQDLKFLLRLLLGTAIEGSAEFSRRARLWEAEINISDPSKMVISPEDETEILRLRYSLIGFLFQIIDSGYDSLSFLDKVSSQAYTLASRMFAPLTNSRFWQPVQERYDIYSDKGESIVNSWTNVGRREERISRELVRKQAYDEIIDDIIKYLSEKPEVRDLIERQSMGLAEDVVEDLRQQSSELDTNLEYRIYKLLRIRQKEDRLPPKP